MRMNYQWLLVAIVVLGSLPAIMLKCITVSWRSIALQCETVQLNSWYNMIPLTLGCCWGQFEVKFQMALLYTRISGAFENAHIQHSVAAPVIVFVWQWPCVMQRSYQVFWSHLIFHSMFSKCPLTYDFEKRQLWWVNLLSKSWEAESDAVNAKNQPVLGRAVRAGWS